MERACAEVLIPETGAETLTWQWTSDGALETTRNGVRIVLGVDPDERGCCSIGGGRLENRGPAPAAAATVARRAMT